MLQTRNRAAHNQHPRSPPAHKTIRRVPRLAALRNSRGARADPRKSCTQLQYIANHLVHRKQAAHSALRSVT